MQFAMNFKEDEKNHLNRLTCLKIMMNWDFYVLSFFFCFNLACSDFAFYLLCLMSLSVLKSAIPITCGIFTMIIHFSLQ